MKSYRITQFQIDRNIAYAIQNVTGDSTQDVLGYFYGIANFVLEDIMKKSKAHHVQKDIILFYKETPMVYKLTVNTHVLDRLNNAHVAVAFPKTLEVQDVSELMNKIVENGLGLSEEEAMPLFEKPNLKTPGCLTKVRKAQYAERSKATTQPVRDNGQRDGENAPADATSTISTT